MKITAVDTLELSIDERIQLVGDIWDTIAEQPEAVVLTGEEEKILDQRLEAYQRDPGAGSPWEEVKERLRRGA